MRLHILTYQQEAPGIKHKPKKRKQHVVSQSRSKTSINIQYWYDTRPSSTTKIVHKKLVNLPTTYTNTRCPNCDTNVNVEIGYNLQSTIRTLSPSCICVQSVQMLVRPSVFGYPYSHKGSVQPPTPTQLTCSRHCFTVCMQFRIFKS